jgi:hypothetical protein
LIHEGSAGKLRAFSSGKIGRVARCAIGLIGGAAGGGLRGGVRSRAPLLRDYDHGAHGKSRGQRNSNSHYDPPRREFTPSGTVRRERHYGLKQRLSGGKNVRNLTAEQLI